jgi:hypothetical protein
MRLHDINLMLNNHTDGVARHQQRSIGMVTSKEDAGRTIALLTARFIRQEERHHVRIVSASAGDGLVTFRRP